MRSIVLAAIAALIAPLTAAALLAATPGRAQSPEPAGAGNQADDKAGGVSNEANDKAGGGALDITRPQVPQPLPHLVVDLSDDRVLDAQAAFHPWHPASLTKMMTAYTVLRAVERGRFDPKTPIKMTWWASQQSPSKMGYRAGTLIPLKDALAMLMVKSANDVAMAIAETVGGSTEGFAAMMNDEARQLGMTSSYFVNPHGLHNERQVTSARDMALLVRALDRYPDWAWLYSTPAIKTKPAAKRKGRVYASFNKLLGRFAGADGMKTGFVCPSGFNLAGTATRDGRRLLAIVFGRNNGTERAIEAARLLQLGFEQIAREERDGVKPQGVALADLKPQGGVPDRPRNMRKFVCETKKPRRVEPFQTLPEGVQGPPGPPRVWLDPPARDVVPLVVRTDGWESPWPDHSKLARLAVPAPRPLDPPIDGEPVRRSQDAATPMARPNAVVAADGEVVPAAAQ